MRTKEELREGVAHLLSELRSKKGLSKTKMAALIGVDKHTWSSWESGVSSPTITDFMYVFEMCGEPMLRPIFNYLYPDTCTDERDTEIIRRNIANFFMNDASDHMVHVWAFLHAGNHGSNIQPQVEEFCAIDHLPMEYRYFIAEQVYVYYMMAMNRGELIETESVMPNMDTWISGLKRGQKAAFRRLQSYNVVSE